MNDIPRGKYLGTPTTPVASEAEHFFVCAECGGYVDMRDLGCVFDHEGPLPHPPADKPQ